MMDHDEKQAGFVGQCRCKHDASVHRGGFGKCRGVCPCTGWNPPRTEDEKQERIAIMTYDGGLSEEEAIRRVEAMENDQKRQG